MAEFIKKVSCPRCRKNGRDASGDNLAVYSDESCHCFSCGYTKVSDEYKKEMGWEDEDDEEDDVMTREAITQEENKKIKANTKVVEWRGIREDTAKTFGIRYEIDTATGEPCRQLVPTTIGGDIVGYKSRDFPKDFSRPIGVVGKECDLAGQFKFQTGGSMVLIVGGEVDQLSAYQMLRDNQLARGKDQYESIAVVSPTVGERSGVNQLKAQYKFLDKFDKIIVGFDSDSAGTEATQKAIAALPKNKVYTVEWRHKDPNKYLTEGKEREFVQDFWKMRPALPAGVVGSGDLTHRMLEEASMLKIEFPPFMEKLNEMTAGGIGLGKIVNIGAASGLGKTSYVNEMLYYWIFSSPYQVGVVSMELNAGQYGMVMLSRHMGKKISAIRDQAEKIAYLTSPEVLEKQKTLFFREDGSHRWHLMDDRDGGIEAVKAVVEELVISCGCRVIVLDPLQDLLDGMSNEEQAVFLKWQKGLVKSHNMTFININHVRKSGNSGQSNSEGAKISEEDFAGSSTIFKSAALNILLTRNKMAEEEVERNTTYAFLSKNRDVGITGPAGEYYYCNDTHTLWDKTEWLKTQPVPEF